MWLPWGKTRRRTLSSSFSFTTFKDVQTLVNEDLPIAGPPPSQDDQNPPSPSSLRPPPKAPSIFHRVRIAASALRTWKTLTLTQPQPPPNRVVLYFTTLRVIRKTFEDCRTVRTILKGLRLSIDERDLSMHAGFHDELKAILGEELSLPQVLVGGRCIGNADEIRQLHETGELKKVLEGVPVAGPGECEVCGGMGFLLCSYCNGSHKCYVEKGSFKSCSLCNENGLVRCISCG
ncbi:uncharacterized protein At5g39865-like [Magnolia sinica]|uniref:uncharacterized protein At5g39865-like n=1 Tax=Magnolia sinica TaxID=86752 RepID=UPI002658F5D9|nr:uncharacterized protein At5g39865-like [Magnolia sinica]